MGYDARMARDVPPTPPGGGTQPPPQRWKRRLVAALLSSVVCLGALELGGRIWAPRPAPPPRGLIEDELLGWGLPADSRFMWQGRQVTTNSLGLRGREPTATAVPLRVLVVGDSSVFGFGLADEQTFPAQLEQLLAPAGAIEVVNGGVPGYTCPQSAAQVGRLREIANPDVLVIYNQHSDVRVAEERDLLYTPAHLGALANWGAGRLVGYLALRVRTASARPGTLLAGYESCLDEMVCDQQAAGGAAVLAIAVGVWDVEGADWTHPGDPAGYRSPQERPDEGADDPGAPYRAAMADVAARTGSPLADLPTVFAGAGMGARALFIDEVHPSAAGQELIAAAVRDAMIDGGLVKLAGSGDPNEEPAPVPAPAAAN